MTMKEAITLFKYYLQSNHKTRTIESYTLLLDRFDAIHAEKLLDDIGPDEIFHFLEDQTRNLAKSTRRLRYAQLKAFYNFIIDRCSLNMRNPCNASLLSSDRYAHRSFFRQSFQMQILKIFHPRCLLLL